MAKVRMRTHQRDTNDGNKKKKVSEQVESRRKKERVDEELLSEEDDEQVGHEREASLSEEEEVDVESADQKRLRVAKAYLDRIRETAAAAEEDGGEEGAEQRAADLLQQEQLEESGRVQRKLADRVVQPTGSLEGREVGRKHRQAVTAICLAEDDSVGFSASKDGLLVQWNIETGQSDKFDYPQEVSGKINGKKQGSRHILTVAVSSDGRYLATGGLDRAVHLWDARTRQHLQAFEGHRGAVTSLVFRQGTQQLMSSSMDRTIKLWSVEDRSYMDTLFGHQSEVLRLDCLRQERILSVGRDRTMRLWKIPEESQLVFRGHQAHLESCCFITNGEFLSGSDDGSVALWNTIRKKPVFIAHSAHGGEAHPSAVDVNCVEGPSVEKSRDEELACRNNDFTAVSVGGAAKSWVGALAVCRTTDLAASGAGDGSVQLWALKDSNRSLQALHKLPVRGFINSLAFAHSGRFLLAGTGQEPRMGRWAKNPAGRNGVIMHSIKLS